MSSDPGKEFRKLIKNDIYQTVDQWREKTIHHMGTISGRWAAWVEKDAIPVVPEARPEAPIKPTSDALMAAIKLEMRQKRLEAAKKEDPEGMKDASIDTITPPTDLQVWREYERAKGVYQDELCEYELKLKLARETFPDENQKVFSALLNCISDSSIQDMKRSPEGSKFFDKHDSYNFLKLAIKMHEHLAPGVSSAAVARAKEDFESLRQKAEDTVTDHINEFKRRYEVLLRARGAGSPTPYADYDLRDLLARSLYFPAWGAWLEYREANENLPATYEALVESLKQAESRRILKAASPLNISMPAAHATKVERAGSPTPGGPTKCQECGTMFCPKKATHVRCDKCQAAFVELKKKERQKSKSAAKRKSAKTKQKKAHATSIEKEENDSASEGEESEGEQFEQGTSFSCICSTRGSSMQESVIYLDNCSNLNVIRDKELALSVRKEKTATRISGSIPGTLVSQVSAELGDVGRGCYDPKFSRNLISEDAAIRAGYRVTRDSGADNCYYLTKPGRPPLVFTYNGEGTFSIPVSRFRRHFSELYGTVNSTDVDRSTVVFTKQQRERAARYHHDHSRCLNHMHPNKIILALRKGLITSIPYTEADVRNAAVIYGPCPVCNQCKGTRHRESGHYPQMPDAPGEKLAGDLFSVMGVLFSVISCRLIKLKCVTRLQNKGAAEIMRAIDECVKVWKGYGAKPKVLSWDQEPGLVHSAAEAWARHSLKVEFTAPDAHERLAEREVRTIKEHVYANIKSLNHAVDDEMIEGIVRDTVTLMNFLPNSETVDGSPRTYLDGERLDYGRWSRVYAGQVAEFEIPYPHKSGQGSRRELGYVLGHQGDNPVVRLLPSGKKTVVRSGHIVMVDKSAAIIKMIEEGITGAKRQRYNDLLVEMREFYEEEPPEEKSPRGSGQLQNTDTVVGEETVITVPLTDTQEPSVQDQPVSPPRADSILVPPEHYLRSPQFVNPQGMTFRHRDPAKKTSRMLKTRQSSQMLYRRLTPSRRRSVNLE